MKNEKLIKARGNKSIEKVCYDLSLMPTIYEKYEKGEREPLPPVKKLIAEYYNMDEVELWG